MRLQLLGATTRKGLSESTALQISRIMKAAKEENREALAARILKMVNSMSEESLVKELDRIEKH